MIWVLAGSLRIGAGVKGRLIQRLIIVGTPLAFDPKIHAGYTKRAGDIRRAERKRLFLSLNT